MLRLTTLFFALVLVSIGFAPVVNAEDITPGYLVGKWDLEGGGKKCDSNESTYVIHSENGAFEYVRDDRAEAVGFWSVEGEVITYQILTSPAYFHDLDASLKAYEDQFHQYTVVSMLADKQKNEFIAISSLGDQISKFTATRCK
jgi:hypothetical protein